MITTIDQAREYRAKIEATTVYAPPEVAVKDPSLYPVWSPDAVNYYDGMTDSKHPQSKVRGRTHPDRLYKCTAPHTSQESWEPDASPSLWVRIDDPEIEWPEWRQPQGSTDAYAKGAKVSHNGKRWISDLDANVWEPGVSGWSEFKE